MRERGQYGEAIKKARKTAGLTQRELAEKLGISATYASDVERGQRNPYSGEKREALKEILGINLVELDIAQGQAEGVLHFDMKELGDRRRLVVENLYRLLQGHRIGRMEVDRLKALLDEFDRA